MNKLIALSLSICLLLAANACDPKHTPPTNPSPKTHRYPVRGKVLAIQDAGQTLRIYHEAVPDFVHITGEADGMDEMAMDLAVGKGVDIAAVKPGDIVSFTLAHYWEPLPAKAWIEQVQVLPADTQLNVKADLDKPADAKPTDPHAGHDHHDHARHSHHDH